MFLIEVCLLEWKTKINMDFFESVKPTRKRVIILFLISVLFIILSFAFYQVKVGVNECGSDCSLGWLDPLYLIIGWFLVTGCFAMCLQTPIPHPLSAPLLQIGFVLLVFSFIYYLYYFKF